MNPNDCDNGFSPLGAPGQILIAPDSFYEDGGPFSSTATPITVTSSNSKKRPSNGGGKEETANKTSKKGNKKNQKKWNQSDKRCDGEITSQVGVGAIPPTLNEFVNLNGSCLKYEMLRQQFASLQHDFMHLKYRYELETAKRHKKKKDNVAIEAPASIPENNDGYDYVPTPKKQSKKRVLTAKSTTSPSKKKKVEFVDEETQRWVDDSFENNEGQLSGSSSSSSSSSP